MLKRLLLNILMQVLLNFLILICKYSIKKSLFRIKYNQLLSFFFLRYCITTKHGPFEWTIYKRYRNFNDLHKALVQFVEAETKRSISDLDK
jgi:hypothetical protein